MTPPLSLSFPLSSSGFLSLCPLPCPSLPRVDQTQTQLEHARIGELEQSLLLEKAQAERLLRELADNRVTRLPLPPATPAPGAPGAPLFGYFLCPWLLSSLFFLSRREVEGQTLLMLHRHRCLLGRRGLGSLGLCSPAGPTGWESPVRPSAALPPMHCHDKGQVQKSGGSWDRSAFCGQSRRRLSMPPFSQLGRWRLGTVDPVSMAWKVLNLWC